jgi:hypothetical protein
VTPSVDIHPHAVGRAPERGISEDEIIQTVLAGSSSPAKFGRTSFRHTFAYGAVWRGRRYDNKEVEAIAVKTADGWLVLTAISRYF